MEQPPQPPPPQEPTTTTTTTTGGTSPETVSKINMKIREDEVVPGPKKDREEWSEGAISTLIDAYTAKYGELNGKGLRSKDWAEVVATVNSKIQNSTKTVEHCRNKMDTLTKRYKSERKNKLAGTDCTWPWYEKMEVIRGCSPSKGTKLAPLGSSPSDSKVSSRAKRARRMPTLEDLSALASDQFAQRHDKAKSSAGGSKSDGKASDTSFGSQSPSFLNFQTMAAVAAAAAAQAATPPPTTTTTTTTQIPTPTNNIPPGTNENGNNNNQEENNSSDYLARSINELASSMRAMAGSLASSITGFAEVYAKVEISKMEIFKDLELKRTQMQLDSQVKIATILSRGNAKRKRENSSDSE